MEVFGASYSADQEGSHQILGPIDEATGTPENDEVPRSAAYLNYQLIEDKSQHSFPNDRQNSYFQNYNLI